MKSSDIFCSYGQTVHTALISACSGSRHYKEQDKVEPKTERTAEKDNDKDKSDNSNVNIKVVCHS